MKSLLVVLLYATIALTQAAPPRIVRDIDRDWKFIMRDVAEAQAAGFDDSRWQSVTLPHTWNVDDGADGGTYYRGPGWYRRHLNVGSDLKGRSLFLWFGAASLVSDVYVNGQLAGHHEGGFGAFCYDISKLANSGDNVVAVRVDNVLNRNVTPLSGDFTVYGGLYRDVKLLALNPISISPLDDASPGVYLRVSTSPADEAGRRPTEPVIVFRTELRNSTAVDATVEVVCTVYDAAGRVEARVDSVASTLPPPKEVVPANGTIEEIEDVRLPYAHFWKGTVDPYLYRVTIEVKKEGKVVDEIEQPLGVRYFSVDREKGFSLNGEPYDIHGVNIHQGRPSVGWASTGKMMDQDYAMIHELGATGVRLPHYQHAGYEYSLCDKYGLVCWAELALVNHMTDNPEFRANAKQQLRELIKQNYNHPSICFWSMYNEPSIDRKIGDGEWDLVKELVSLSHKLDPTRLTTGAASMAAGERMNWYMDITAINRYWGWYDGEATLAPSRLESMLKETSGRPFGISEFGAGASIQQHENHPKHPKTDGPWHPEEYQASVHETLWASFKDKPWIWCKLLWVMFDFPSDARKEGDHAGMNDKGLVTGDRKTRKDAFYFYKANWTTDPFVYITDRRFNARPPGPSDLKVYSNCESVELWVNGRSLGSKTARDHVFLWPAVDLVGGPVEVRAVGKSGDKTVIDQYVVAAKS